MSNIQWMTELEQEGAFASLLRDMDEPWRPLQRHYAGIISGYAPQPEQDDSPLVMAGIALVLGIIGAALAFRRWA